MLPQKSVSRQFYQFSVRIHCAKWRVSSGCSHILKYIHRSTGCVRRRKVVNIRCISPFLMRRRRRSIISCIFPGNTAPYYHPLIGERVGAVFAKFIQNHFIYVEMYQSRFEIPRVRCISKACTLSVRIAAFCKDLLFRVSPFDSFLDTSHHPLHLYFSSISIHLHSFFLTNSLSASHSSRMHSAFSSRSTSKRVEA